MSNILYHRDNRYARCRARTNPYTAHDSLACMPSTQQRAHIDRSGVKEHATPRRNPLLSCTHFHPARRTPTAPPSHALEGVAFLITKPTNKQRKKSKQPPKYKEINKLVSFILFRLRFGLARGGNYKQQSRKSVHSTRGSKNILICIFFT